MRYKTLALIALSVTAFSVSLTGAGVAAAMPDVTGMTYDNASSTLSGAGLKPTVASRVGDQKSQGQCVVTNARLESVPQRGNHPTTGSKVLLAVNCYAVEASATSPGYSAASTEGRAAAAAVAASATATAAKPGH